MSIIKADWRDHMPRLKSAFLASVSLSLLVALLISFFVTACSQDIPLNTPISLSPPNFVEQKIQITGLRHNYEIELQFSRTAISFEQAETLIGAMGNCVLQPIDNKSNWNTCPKGIPIPIRWSLRSTSGNAVALSGEDVTLDSSGWASDYVARHVGKFHVKRGDYIFRIEALKDVPELAHVPTRVFIYEEVIGEPFFD